MLEAAWNAKLRALAEAQDEVARHRQAAERGLGEAERSAIRALAADFPRLWRDPRTPDRERKRMARLLLEDVTLRKGDELVVQVRFRGGASETLTLPRPLSAAQGRRTAPDLVAEIDRLLDDHTDAEVAAALNAGGHRSYGGKPFHALRIASLRRSYRLADHRRRLQARGLLTERALAAALGVAPETVEQWWRRGYLRAERANDKGERLYHPPGEQAPAKWQRKPPRGQLPPESGNGGAVCD